MQCSSHNTPGAIAPSTNRAPLNVVHVLEDIAQRFPHRVALFFPSRGPARMPASEGQMTFQQLEEEVGRLASSFRARGIAKGDRAVVMIPMSRELYLVLLALMKLAATAVFIEPSMGLSQMVRCCQLSNPKAFVGTRKALLLCLFSRAFRRVPLKFVAHGASLPGAEKLHTLLLQRAPRVGTEHTDEDTPALISFTSGSTGSPKATSRSHSFLWAQHTALTSAFAFTSSDVDLSALPIYVLHNLASRVPTVLPATRSGSTAMPNPARVVQQVRDCGVSTIRGSTAFYETVAQYCSGHAITLSTVRALFIGGAPVRPGLVRSLKRAIPNGEVYVVYGSTEAEPIAAISADDILRETWALTAEGWGNCVGFPQGTIEVRVIKCREGPVDLASEGLEAALQPRGMVGEIVITGDPVNKTYFQNPQAVIETKFKDERGRVWHRTGDTGYLDERDRLWLVGRMSNRILRAGGEVHPLQVEPIIDALGFVDRCALLGLPDAKLGQKAVLIVAPKSKGTLHRIVRSKEWRREIERLCRLRGLPIDEVRFKRVVPLDRRHRGKIDYDKLRVWYRNHRLASFIL
jgi:acyl-CoA synthetase (AMP-forming)/AMP-acid ligase II